MIFDQIRSVAHTKQEIDIEPGELSPYMLQRWLSMYSGPVAGLLNGTTNIAWNAKLTDQQWYQLFMMIVPRLPFRKISYIKKPPKDKVKSERELDAQALADLMQISCREAKQYLEMNQELSQQIEDPKTYKYKTNE